MSEKKNNTKNIKEKSLSKLEKLIYTTVIVLLVIAIVSVSVLVLYPKLAGRPDWHIKAFFSFDNSEWIEEMAENRVEPIDKVFDMTSSFVYSEDSAFITQTYSSEATIAEAREYYLEQIPQSVDYDDGKYVELEINGNLNGEEIEVKNYEADVFNAFETKIDINEDMAAFLRKMLIAAFPVDLVASYPELAVIMQNDKLGGYVMYNDDELSTHSYPGIPIYSEAYRFKGDKELLTEMQLDIKNRYTNSLYFEDEDTLYFMDNGHIFSVAITESDLNLLAVISVQKIPPEVLAEMEQ